MTQTLSKILYVEDEDDIRTIAQLALETVGGFVLKSCGGGAQALREGPDFAPDLILLDVMMPEMDGYQFIRTYRKESDTPIILLTAKPEESDKVLGLELGADDYMTKPFGMRELLARIHAVLRRTNRPAAPINVLRVADVVLDEDTHSVMVGDTEVKLTPSEFALLAVLMASPGRVFSRIDLLERLQGTSFEGITRTIDVHVRNLRTKIEPDPTQPKYIETVFGVGYKFVGK